ncbi:DinB family protein [Bacteroides thetaiotaomicron]|uniref:DinB family protein n=1 Tax=Bacteroides thetaiotaomicron TaxID=818 RepID=UPI0021660AE8|nr:DinB family protein [Bacteroides thetaiotaomicron]MCS3197490.1 DinB family protein [Bacteroides thetaiotaomicron]
MSKIDFLKEQLIEARTFVNRLMSELPEDLWYTIPEGTDSNFIWQAGHLLVSQNFHTMTAVTGVNERVGRLIPIKEYNRLFNGMGTLHRSIEKDLIPVAVLKKQLETVHQICIENLETLHDDVLAEFLEPLPFKHPVAEIKYEALAWSYKHEMWHSAEMEAIKRDLGYPIVWMK